MKTDDFILALSPTPPRAGRRWGGACAGAGARTCVSLALFMAALGPRPDVTAAAHTMRFDLKFLDTLALLGRPRSSACGLSRPEASAGAVLAWLLAPVVLLALAVGVELATVPAELWARRLVGANWWQLPDADSAVRDPAAGGADRRLARGRAALPGLTGALAGMAAAGVSATIYATNCTDDSPLFVATWYPLATGIVALAGFFAGRRWLRW